MKTALEVLQACADLPGKPAIEAEMQVTEFVAKMLKTHEPLTGEAYPQDKNRYCAVCIGVDGGSARWPCGTVRAIRKHLCPKEPA